ncbi:gp53-like domain-containing protein [Citrobacter freundii]
MATNNFKPFATAANANVTAQADWESLPALLSGFTAGKASSAQVNKAIRQASFIAAALAQYTANKSGLDVLDDGDLNGFIAKMSAAFGKDFQALDATLTALAGLTTGANKLPYFTGTDTASQTDLTSVGRDIIGKGTIADILTYLGVPDLLKGKQDADNTLTALARLAGAANKLPYFSGPDVMSMTDFSDIGRAIIAASTKSSVLSYLELGSAAKKNTGTDADQIPDMSSFAFGSRWITLPSGHIIQFDVLTAGVGDKANWPVTNYPIPFPNELLLPPVAIHTGNGAADTSVNFIVDTEASLTRFRAGTTGLTPQNGAYIAIGR